MWRTMKMAAVALSATLALSGLALAQRDYDGDRDDHYRGGDQAQRRGYDRGYRDGVDKGRHEGREHDPFDYQTPDWRQATRGYERWMGPVELYQRGYQEGYRNGFGTGYRETARGWRDGDHDRDDRWQNDGWRTRYDPDWASVANRFGYEDGRTAAREDLEHRKSYNSKPRGRFGDRLDGYRREFGSRDRYRAEYTAGYRQGYDSVMRRY
jgi:hypothetical protein